MALKWLRDNLRHLKFILWGVVAVFVLLVFVDWGAGRAGGSGGGGAAVRVGDRTVSETEFLNEMRRLDQRFSEIYGDRWSELRSQVESRPFDGRMVSSSAPIRIRGSSERTFAWPRRSSNRVSPRTC